jgi:hypothetical protein
MSPLGQQIFDSLADIGRADAAIAKCRAAMRKDATRKWAQANERSLEQINAEILALHDRAEARAINSGAW